MLVLLDSRVEKLSDTVRLQSGADSQQQSPVVTSGHNVTRTCHGCHGPMDESHRGYQSGADPVSGCLLDHYSWCEGGIRAGKDRCGGVWRACPIDYVQMQDVEDDDKYDEENLVQDMSYLGANGSSDNVMTTQLGGAPNLSQHFLQTTNTAQSIPTSVTATTTQSTAGYLGLASQAATGAQAATSGATVSLASSGGGLMVSSVMAENDVSSQVVAARARLAGMKKRKEELEILADLRHQEELMQAETASLQQKLVQQPSSVRAVGTRPKVSEGAASLRTDNRSVNNVVDNGFCGGPSLPQIRKTPGLPQIVERGIDRIRSDVPSLARRPSAVSGGQAQSRMQAQDGQYGHGTHLIQFQS